MRSSVLVVTQPTLVVVGRPFVTADRSHSQDQAAFTLADGTDKLSRNIGKYLPTYVAYQSRRGKTSSTPRRKLEISQISYACFVNMNFHL
jgi:hypothetical protein